MDYKSSVMHPTLTPDQHKHSESIGGGPSEEFYEGKQKEEEHENIEMHSLFHDAGHIGLNDQISLTTEISSIITGDVTSVKLTNDQEDFQIKAQKVILLEDPNEPSSTQNQGADKTDLSSSNLTVFFDLDKKSEKSILFDSDVVESVEEEESEPSFVEEVTVLDREPYYEKYDQLSKELPTNRVKNNLFQKLLAMYFRKRKTENFIRETDPPLDQVQKYHHKLDAFEELNKINESQRTSAHTEVEALKQKKDVKNAELTELVKNMQFKEQSIGRGLIYVKTGNQISDKLVAKLIKTQSIKIDQVSSMRLKYIKLKEMVQEKLCAIGQLDLIENNLSLADYEQLKSDNRDYADKIEEKDEELRKLRLKYQSTTQILAHMREKSSALETDLLDLIDESCTADKMSSYLRENVAHLKQSKDRCRRLIMKLKDECGLLTHKNLLIDMEMSLKELKRKEIELVNYKEELTHKTEVVRILRKNIERLTEIANRRRISKNKLKGYKYNKDKPMNAVMIQQQQVHQRRGDKLKDDTYSNKSMNIQGQQQVYKRHPYLYMPTVKEDLFKDLVNIRPSPTVLNKNKH